MYGGDALALARYGRVAVRISECFECIFLIKELFDVPDLVGVYFLDLVMWIENGYLTCIA